MEDQAISEQLDRDMDLRRLSSVSKLDSVVLNLPTFRGESAAGSPVNNAGDPEVGYRSMTAAPLSCEDFDEDDWEYEHA
jgi:hypothetical protein